MSTLRQDPTTEEWVILAPERAARPHAPGAEGVRQPEPEYDPQCPFCPGNEEETPPEISRVPAGAADWSIRVVPNLFAAVVGEASPPNAPQEPFRELPAGGTHEVIVESPRHDARLEAMPSDQVALALRAWRDRYRDLAERPDARAVVLFRNFGPSAGTSRPHPHAQIMTVPVLTPEAVHRLEVARRHRAEAGRSVYDDVVAAELEAGDRVLARAGNLVAFCPFFGGTPYETWIATTAAQPSFADAEDADLDDLAGLLPLVLGALARAAGDPDYNLLVSWTPTEEADRPAFRWHVAILPRLSIRAGFELGSGMRINTVPPEAAAAALRDALEEDRLV